MCCRCDRADAIRGDDARYSAVDHVAGRVAFYLALSALLSPLARPSSSRPAESARPGRDHVCVCVCVCVKSALSP